LRNPQALPVGRFPPQQKRVIACVSAPVKSLPLLAKPRKVAMLIPLFMQQLEIKTYAVAIGENEIIRDLSLSVAWARCMLLWPNGSGKSTLAKVIAGHPITR